MYYYKNLEQQWCAHKTGFDNSGIKQIPHISKKKNEKTASRHYVAGFTRNLLVLAVYNGGASHFFRTIMGEGARYKKRPSTLFQYRSPVSRTNYLEFEWNVPKTGLKS